MGEIAAILRRHFAAVVAVMAAAAVVGCAIAFAPVTYQESGTLYLLAPPAPWQSKPATQPNVTGSGTEVPAILSILLMSPHGQRQVRSAGAMARFDVAPVNLGSLQYPNYSEHDITVTTSGTDPGRVRTSFGIATRVLNSDLNALQAQAGAPVRYRMTTSFPGGPSLQAEPGSRPSLQAEPGSWPRVYGGLAVLAIVATFAVVILLERRRPRSAAANRRAASA